LVLAEIDEADGGDQREALRHAATADPDPVWRCTACRTVCVEWHPSCPNCFTVGSLRWTTGSVATPLLQVQPATPLLLP
jgi:HemY protein